jgi:hypothetical protein
VFVVVEAYLYVKLEEPIKIRHLVADCLQVGDAGKGYFDSFMAIHTRPLGDITGAFNL